MSEATASVETVEVLLFRVGDRRYGADAHQVLGVGRSKHGDVFGLDGLGPLREGGRALLFEGEPGKAHGLVVDVVEGVKRLPCNDLRRVPELAGVEPYTVGLWLDGSNVVFLIDLNEGLKFHQRQ
jgi:chemotaxis signal transduction protein